MRLCGTDAALPVIGLPEALLGSAGRDFCGPSWRPEKTWENSLRDASGIGGMNFLTPPWSWLWSEKTPASCCRESGGVRPWEPSGSVASSPVLPLDLFDQPTIQTISQLSEQPSMADLDALAADPSPLLDAMAELDAANERYLMLLVI